MGEIAAKERAFRFTRTTNIGLEARRLAELYLECGIPYAKSIASYEALLPLFESRVDRLGAYPERFASCLFLIGQIEEANRFATDFLSKQKDYFEGFAIPFLEIIKKETACLA
jgi:hypothetical protein